MTELDNVLRPAVMRMIEDMGKVVTLRRGTTTYDPDTDQTTYTDPVEYSIKASPPTPVTTVDVDGRVIMPTDTEVWTAEQDAIVNPEEDDIIVIDGVEFKVVSGQLFYSGELPCARRLILRGLT